MQHVPWANMSETLANEITLFKYGPSSTIFNPSPIRELTLDANSLELDGRRRATSSSAPLLEMMQLTILTSDEESCMAHSPRITRPCAYVKESSASEAIVASGDSGGGGDTALPPSEKELVAAAVVPRVSFSNADAKAPLSSFAPPPSLVSPPLGLSCIISRWASYRTRLASSSRVMRRFLPIRMVCVMVEVGLDCVRSVVGLLVYCTDANSS